MPDQQDKDTAAQMGLHDGQIRMTSKFTNLWWSITGDPSKKGGRTFGYGDLDDVDLRRILEWTSHPSHVGVVFTGWNQHHGTQWQQCPEAMVQISFPDGITFPRREATRKQMKVVK